MNNEFKNTNLEKFIVMCDEIKERNPINNDEFIIYTTIPIYRYYVKLLIKRNKNENNN